MSTAAHLDVHLCKHVPRLHSWTYGHPSVYIIADMHIITLATHLLGFVGFIGGECLDIRSKRQKLTSFEQGVISERWSVFLRRLSLWCFKMVCIWRCCSVQHTPEGSLWGLARANPCFYACLDISFVSAPETDQFRSRLVGGRLSVL